MNMLLAFIPVLTVASWWCGKCNLDTVCVHTEVGVCLSMQTFLFTKNYQAASHLVPVAVFTVFIPNGWTTAAVTARQYYGLS